MVSAITATLFAWEMRAVFPVVLENRKLTTHPRKKHLLYRTDLQQNYRKTDTEWNLDP